MSLNLTNHFYKLRIQEPSFAEYYYDHLSKTDYNQYLEEVHAAIKQRLRRLLINQGRDIGVAIDAPTMLYEPLIKLGIPYNTVVVGLRELFSEEVGYLKVFNRSPEELTLTPKGKNWVLDRGDDAVYNTHADNQNSKQGFVASWFHESTEESIKAIEQGISESGYSSMCIKDEHYSDTVMNKALSEIRKSKFVIADLTGDRHSVFFEAGFAFALGVEIIYVYKESDTREEAKLEFYAKHYKCSKYKTVEELKEIVKKAIAARIK